MNFSTNSTVQNEVPYENWFIPIDILVIVCISIGIVLSLIFFLTILFDKTCHTVPMMLTGNSCLLGFIFGLLILNMRIFTLKNDFYRSDSIDLFCSFRGYFGYASCSIQNCSYLLQAIYRLILVIYPNRLIFQSMKFQFFLIVLTYFFGLLYPLIFLLDGEIIYNVHNQICQLPLKLSFSIIYMANFAYITPVSCTIITYFILVFYVKKMSHRVVSLNNLNRAKRELKMVRRTVILVSILVILCFPYALLIFSSFFISIPIYHFRIAYIFLDVAYLFVILVLYQFTDQLQLSLTKKIKRQSTQIMPTIT